MRLKFWDQSAPSPSGECAHMWSNWSAPTEVQVSTTSVIGWQLGPTIDRAGMAQDRYCLKCNIYERRCT